MLCLLLFAGACQSDANATKQRDAVVATRAAELPLVVVADVDLPGGATRFDYQAIDAKHAHLVISHMNDGTVLFLKLSDGTLLKELPGIPTARGVVVADNVGLVFVTSLPNTLVIIDSKTMTESARVKTGNGPDGVGWDPRDNVVGVSDQTDGALSLIPNAGRGTRAQIKLGTKTGNVVFDAKRGWFWITVVAATPPDQLVAVDPVASKVTTTVELPGCNGAHGLRLHPDGKSAFIACEANSVLARVDLNSAKMLGSSPTGAVPDVMSIDPELGWLYMAAESGDLTVFDINEPGVTLVGHDKPGSSAHSVAVDPSTHRVFFPLMAGPAGTPVLRIMRPTGT
jgi:DNA-binding beta-propeller fold protein YncE